MRWRWWLIGFAVLGSGHVAAQEADELLARIKGTAAANLGRLPNYTCTETIQRSMRSRAGKVMRQETIRLEVAYLAGQELFGWPGATKIDEPDIAKMISGSIGNGYFALFPKTVFSNPLTTFQYGDEKDLEGKHAIRYDYVVPQISETYHLKSDFGEAAVGFHGSFWVDAGTYGLLRITVTADDPPVALGMAATSSILDYERQKIGNSAFVLPRSAEMEVTTTEHMEERSSLNFRACHEFIGESVLKFDEPTEEKAAASATPVAVVNLPYDFTVDFSLETPIEWGAASGGDAVRGILREDVRSSDETIVPKGARLSGRIAHVVLRAGLYYVELALTSLDFEGGHAELSGRRNGVSLKNEPLIYNSTHFKLGAGARLTLHSRLIKSVHNDSIRP